MKEIVEFSKVFMYNHELNLDEIHDPSAYLQFKSRNYIVDSAYHEINDNVFGN